MTGTELAQISWDPATQARGKAWDPPLEVHVMGGGPADCDDTDLRMPTWVQPDPNLVFNCHPAWRAT